MSALSTNSTRMPRRHRGSHEALKSTEPAASEIAARMMSETAHDLRSPLTTVRESIRLVHDGDLGELSKAQQSYLQSAIDQCECMDQMIGEMVQLERLRTGAPRAMRSWVKVSAIRDTVQETLRPWSLPRQIDVLWDTGEHDGTVVFADPSMLRRLIVNLVTNAIRACEPESCVLIRVTYNAEDETIQWAVIDQGSGINEADMKRIADRRVSLGDGEGLGLSICRQLAAVHFTTLKIRSREGIGTEVSFKTAAIGPRSVANAWSAWRVAVRGLLQTPKNRFLPSAASSVGSVQRTSRRSRLDPPSVTIELSHEATTPRCEDRLAAGVVSLGAAVSRENADDFDQVLQSQMQMFDLSYRTETRRWVWILDTDAHGVQDRIDSIRDAAIAKAGSARMTWTEPQMIPIDNRRTHARLSDLMVRQILSAGASSRILDQDEVRLGTKPIERSEIAEARLEAELLRLTAQLKSQTKRLSQNAGTIRRVND